jgi:hypothetical protein
MYDKIYLMLPTYKRIDKLSKFIQSAQSTVSDPESVILMLCINENDSETAEYIKQNPPAFDIRIINEKTQQPNLPVYYNSMAASIPARERDSTVISMVGDDMVFVTQGWDKIVLDMINNNNGEVIVYGDDDYIGHDKLMVHLFTTFKMVEATEKLFMCPAFHADMIDIVWTNVGLLTGTARYIPELHIRHEHESKKGQHGDFDETFRRMMPLRVIANERENRMYAWRYANLCAANMIDNGIGKWNIL